MSLYVVSLSGTEQQDNLERCNLYNYLYAQKKWSINTFGPGDGKAKANGLVDHIRKELIEVLEDPNDTTEWCDIAILAFEGALRSAESVAHVIDALEAKQNLNLYGRTWPDWRTVDQTKAIEHIKE